MYTYIPPFKNNRIILFILLCNKLFILPMCSLPQYTQHPHSFLFFFFWPRYVACGILVPQPGIKPVPPAVEARSLNHWTTREVPASSFFLTAL